MQHKAMVLFIMTACLAAMSLGQEDGCLNAIDSASSVCAGRTADDSVSMLQTSMRVHPIHSKDSSPDGEEVPAPNLLGDKECASQMHATRSDKYTKKVLVATPLKNAAHIVQPFAATLARLSYPKSLLSVAFLVSDSYDDTARVAAKAATQFLSDFANVSINEENFGYEEPGNRHALEAQPMRRSILAKSRNALLKHSLTPDIDAVLWLDADILGIPKTMVQDLLDVGRPIVAPHVLDGTSDLTYDKNSWRRRTAPENQVSDKIAFFEAYSDSAEGGIRDHMDDLRKMLQDQHARDWRYAFKLDGAGSAVLLVDAKLHRDKKLLFPDIPYKHRLESEGFALLAEDAGFHACGLPLYFVRHRGHGVVSLRSLLSNETLPACVATAGWDAGFGPCSTYGPNGHNNYYCPYDFSDGSYAKEVCPECGLCKGVPVPEHEKKPPPACSYFPDWDAGYGPCSTYAPKGMNHYYCSMDYWEGEYAEDVCKECGHCE
jgi:hypothetical protein